MVRRPPIATRPDPLFPHAPLVRSFAADGGVRGGLRDGRSRPCAPGAGGCARRAAARAPASAVAGGKAGGGGGGSARLLLLGLGAIGLRLGAGGSGGCGRGGDGRPVSRRGAGGESLSGGWAFGGRAGRAAVRDGGRLMLYLSTRGASPSLGLSEAIRAGAARDGGPHGRAQGC